MDISKVVVAVLAFGLNSGAYYNEIISPVFMHTDYGFQFTGNDLALDNQNTRYNIFNPRQVAVMLNGN